jgi:hypothetical protein
MGRNSWGQDWGILGDYYITQADLDDILSGDGEVLMAVKFVTPAPPAPTPTPTPDAKGCLTSALALLGAFHGNSKKVKQATALIKKALSEL